MFYEDGMSPSEGLFFSLFAFIQQRLALDVETVEGVARGVLEKIKIDLGRVTWESARFATINEARFAANLGAGLRITAHVAGMRNPMLIEVPEQRGRMRIVEATNLALVDLAGDEMQSVDIVGAMAVQKARQARAYGAVELLCIPVAMPIVERKRVETASTSRKEFFLYIVDLKPSDSALNLIGATDQERSDVAELLPQLAKRGMSPLNYMVNEIIVQLGIVGLDDFPLLRHTLEFVVLQSMSWGRVHQNPASLHGLVIGPPGAGKKLLGAAARALNPVAVQISPAKATAAGLVGASRATKEGWKSQAGALPMASGGVATLQDAHTWSRSTLGKVAAILQEAMEDGFVYDSVAGGIRREAHTSLLIDLNRTAHLGIGPAAPEAPLITLRPLLSRFDLICEIPPDPSRAWLVGASMYGAMKAAKSGPPPSWIRNLRVLVAALRDRHAVVDLEGVTDAMANVHREIFENNRHQFERVPHAGDFATRLPVSFAKLVCASARAHDRSNATEQDVHVALPYLSRKLDFMRFVPPSEMSMPPESPRADRAVWFHRYVNEHAGAMVTASTVLAAYTEETGDEIDQRTARRWLKKTGAKERGKGTWLLPETTSGDNATNGEPVL